ncbi:Hypothetical_protein [Hexamita inflata]|uniref:Hypothetical_protein n=1 Tax=Hexamita inflata TaxID=28002 RepID=A0AA86P714_9EUKA|nr:Hypothetical protein HINF_LOCUS19180 [Hexamita inflata]CAI9931539.1 Hypothetical protein HINF_LOCUS19184 [Hexamita inflata]
MKAKVRNGSTSLEMLELIIQKFIQNVFQLEIRRLLNTTHVFGNIAQNSTPPTKRQINDFRLQKLKYLQILPKVPTRGLKVRVDAYQGAKSLSEQKIVHHDVKICFSLQIHLILLPLSLVMFSLVFNPKKQLAVRSKV